MTRWARRCKAAKKSQHLAGVAEVFVIEWCDIYIYINSIWVNYNDLSATSLESWFLIGESSPNGRKIQVSEML